MILTNLTAPEVKALDRETTLVFFPLASTEQHGPHLPLGTKAYIAETFAYEANKELKKDGFTILVPPTFPFSPCQASFGLPSSFSINARIFSDLLYEIGQSFQREGFKWFFFINPGISPECVKAVGEAITDLNKLENFKAFDPLGPWIFSKKPLLDDLLRHIQLNPEKEIHGDVKETSAILYINDEFLKEDIARDLPSVPINIAWEKLKGNFSFKEMGAVDGYIGTPAKADPEVGRVYIEEGGHAIADYVRQALRGQPLPGLPLGIKLYLKLIDLDDSG